MRALALLVVCLSAPAGLAQPGAFALGGAGSESGTAVDVAPDGAVAVGGTYVQGFDLDAGETTLPSAAFDNGFLAVYEADGALRFAVPLLSGGADDVYDVAFTSTGDVAVLGQAGEALDLDPGAGETIIEAPGFEVRVYLAVYTSAGALRYGVGLPGVTFVQEGALAADDDGNVYVGATLDGTLDLDPGAGEATVSGVNDGLLVSYDAAGAFRFGFALGPGTLFVRGLDVAGDRVALAASLSGTVDADPGAAVREVESNGSLDVFVATFTTSGNLASAFAIGTSGADTARDVAIDADGRLAVVAQIQSPTDVDPGVGERIIGTEGGELLGAYLLASYDADLSVRYATNLASVVPGGVAIRDGDVVYAASAPTGDFDVDPSDGTTVVSTTDGYDGLVVALDGAGALRWANTVAGSGGGDNALALALAADGSVIATGRFSDSVTLAEGQGLTATGGYDIFVTSYGPSGDLRGTSLTDGASHPTVDDPRLVVWPNPSSGLARVRLVGVSSPARLEVIDALGRVLAGIHQARAGDVVLPPLPAGVYTVRASAGREVVSARLVVAR